MTQIHASYDTRVIDPLKLTVVSATNAARGTVRLASAIQDRSEAERILAAAALFTLICKVYGLNPLDLYHRASALMVSADSASWNPQFRALRDYMQVWSKAGQFARRDRKQELNAAASSV